MAHAQQHEEENKEDCSQGPKSGRKEAYDDLIASLPSDDSWWGFPLHRYRRFWCPELPVMLSINDTFEARPSDIVLVSQPKSGTTWLKSIAFSILNRRLHHPSSPHHPLLASNPHNCVPFLRSYYDAETLRPDAALDSRPSPRLVALHHSYSALPGSVPSSGCKIVYLARDPKDTLVSQYHFFGGLPRSPDKKGLSFDQAFELFCSGVSFYGPVWEHQLEYWRESLGHPERVMFIKYEDIMADTAGHVKKLAEFMGCRFEEEEEEAGVVGEIVSLCSFDSLSSAAVNREGDRMVNRKGGVRIQNSAFFRKGKVGDWRNHMSGEMAMRLDGITVEKFAGSGLGFPSGSG